jgi:hypothetical protein
MPLIQLVEVLIVVGVLLCGYRWHAEHANIDRTSH